VEFAVRRVLSVFVLGLVSCGPGTPRLYHGPIDHEVMVVVEPNGRREVTTHLLFAQIQRRSSGDYARLDVRKSVDCKAGKLLMKDVTGYSASGEVLSTVSQPAAWAPAEGSEAITLRIVCDREFAATRALHAPLDQLQAFYKAKVAKAS
jgi:hypothetical protein